MLYPVQSTSSNSLFLWNNHTLSYKWTNENSEFKKLGVLQNAYCKIYSHFQSPEKSNVKQTLDPLEKNISGMLYSLYFYTYRPPEQMGQQFFSISFKKVDFCWIMHLVNKTSNDYKIMFSLDNNITHKQSMPCSTDKLPNKNVFNSSLWCILCFSIKITWSKYSKSNSIAPNKSQK